MAGGLLQIHGTIDVSQFWPQGTSDADTTKVLVAVNDAAFQFRVSAAAPFKTTTFYKGAKVRGRSGTKPTLNAKNQLTIRLQGIDAPELHYRPSPLTDKERKAATDKAKAQFKALNHSYRQPLGATASNALSKFLGKPGQGIIPCRVWTQVDHPNEVFDTYARLVGDIEVSIGGKAIDINHWLVEQGQAFPTFYSSMTEQEINDIIALAKIARSAKRGIWTHVAKTIGAFDFTLLEPKKGDVALLAKDKGPVLFPKLFRRQCSFAPRKKAAIIKQTFQQYLAASPDFCFETSDFLDNGVHSATPFPFSNFIKSGKTVLFDAAGLVFKEAPSKLIGVDGKEVTKF
jgi:endonuclease YncB( thermonuclease family)